MRSRSSCIGFFAVCTLCTALSLFVAADLPAQQSVAARNLKMRRADRPDTSDIDAVLASIITPGMTDEQKAKAIWKFAMSMRHQDNPPSEQICSYPTDGIKVFNVYGYNYCSMVAGAIGALADRAGLQQRQRGINSHNVMEIYYNGAWHMFDGSLINYYTDTDNVTVASVDSLIANSGSLINQAHCAYFDSNGWYPALTHNITSTLAEYNGSSNAVLTDGVGSGYKIGYKCLLNLREGETLVRNCANSSNKHVNQYAGGAAPGCLNQTTLTGGDMGYIKSLMPSADFPSTYYFHQDYINGIVGNGAWTYTPDLANGTFRDGEDSETNLACTSDDALTPALHPASLGTATYVYRMQSPYIFLEGSIAAQFVRANSSQAATVAVSTNNGLDWQTVYTASTTGTINANIDIGSKICRRYDFLVKVTLTAVTANNNIGLNSLTTACLVQHHQRAMPFLVPGSNSIVVDGGGATQTVTVTGQFTPNAAFTDNETQATEHALLTNINIVDNYCWMVDGQQPSSICWPITVKGDVTAVRFGGCFRVNNTGQTANLQVSTTGPTSGFTTVGTVTGPTRLTNKWLTYTGVPAGVRNLWVRFEFVGTDTIGVMGQYRIDVDYTEPSAVEAPFTVTHQWTDAGGAQSHTETITTLPHTYSITAGANAAMTALTIAVANPVVSGTAPTITTPPTALTVTAGSPASFTVAAAGTAPLTYVWKQGTTVVGTNSNTYSIASAQASNNGSYTVTISNGSGTVTSSPVTLTVNPAGVAPGISAQPVSLTVTAGTPATFSVSATGTAPLTYVWKMGATVVGGNASGYTIASAQAGNIGSYTVTISNGFGNITSNVVTLTVNAAGNPVTVNTPSVTLSAPAGSTTVVSTTITLTNTSGSAITVGITDGQVWLTEALVGAGGTSVTIPNGGSATFTIAGDPTGLSGTMTGSLTITNTPGGTTRTIPVSFSMSGTGGSAGAVPLKRGGCAIAVANADGTMSCSGLLPWLTALSILTLLGMAARRRMA